MNSTLCPKCDVLAAFQLFRDNIRLITKHLDVVQASMKLIWVKYYICISTPRLFFDACQMHNDSVVTQYICKSLFPVVTPFWHYILLPKIMPALAPCVAGGFWRRKWYMNKALSTEQYIFRPISIRIKSTLL